MPKPTWTPDQIARVRELWEADELSAREIGAMFSVSKSAIIGLANRNCFSKKASGFEKGHDPAKDQRPKRIKPGAKRAPLYRASKKADRGAPADPYGPKYGGCLNVEERIDFGVFRYCRKPVKEGSSWCPEHHARFHWTGYAYGQASKAQLEKMMKAG